MPKNKSKKRQLTYHQMEDLLCEMANVLEKVMQRVNNLEYGIFSYIEFRKTGKRFNKWMDTRSKEAKEKEGVKNAVHKDEAVVGKNLEDVTKSEGRRTEGVRTP